MKKINPFTEFKEHYITELQFCENYLIWNHPQNLKALQVNLENTIACIIRPDIKLGLEIIFILLSHSNQEIKALSLEHLFFLFHNTELRKIIINELKYLTKVDEAVVSDAANYSLDNITHHISPFEIVAYLNRLYSDIEYKMHQISHLKYISLQKKLANVETEFKKHPNFLNIYFELDSLFYELLNFSYNMESKIIDEDSSKFEWADYENGILHINELKQLEYDPLNPLQKLSKMYGATFKEKGHLRRLKAYLDDKDPEVRLIGLISLVDISYTLLTNSNSKKILKPNLTPDKCEKTYLSSNINAFTLDDSILEGSHF